MDVKLENENFKVVILEKGAELSSMKNKLSKTEYIWRANTEYWGRHAPILFPIVGKVNNNSYRIDKKTYNLSQHGFARDMNFSVVENSENHALFSLIWTEDTLKLYPYKFQLFIEYRLQNNTLHICYTVKNCDTQSIYFSIGAHPGFNCPLGDFEAIDDYYFEFEKNEDSMVSLLNEDGLLLRDKQAFLKNQRILPISKKLFKNDALIFHNLNSNRISIKDKNNKEVVTVDFTGFPFLGLWSKPTGAPFVCIEPWFGHADYADFIGDFRDKEDIITLSENEEFKCSFSITVS